MRLYPQAWYGLPGSQCASRCPSHVVCAWMGNSERIAAKHYLQVRDSDFERALEVVRNPVRAMAINDANGRHGVGAEPTENVNIRQETLCAANAGNYQMGDTGLELCPYSPRNTQILNQAAQNAAHLLPRQGSAMAIWLN